jgi:hypothetical protein
MTILAQSERGRTTDSGAVDFKLVRDAARVLVTERHRS